MPFCVRQEVYPCDFEADSTIVIAEDDAGNRLDVWPGLGFNAFRWRAAGVELLYRDPALFQDKRPSRSGFPILFPFPNRIRDGRFVWQGRQFQLPANDPTQRNAIHGFGLAASWHLAPPVVNVGFVELSATFTHRDRDTWPAPFELTVTYRLSDRALVVIAEARAFDQPLPMGLGYHPYFLVEPFGGDDAMIDIAASRLWPLDKNLPSGPAISVPTGKDLRNGRAFGTLTLDDVFGGLTTTGDSLNRVAAMRHPTGRPRLELWVSPEFRELVAFTPPHRKAICLEPYTCTTDAINLQALGLDAGWFVLPSGQTWRATIRCVFSV